jgi:cellulose biosynthesis protein BcsQ
MVELHLLPEDIRRIRRQLGETQAEFARRLAVDPVTVARWEIGQRRCTGLHAITIARLDPGGTLFGRIHKEGSMTHDYSTIAFFSHKGGVSKTTTTYNLGWALANAGKRVLMIDGDPQCNLTGMTLSLGGHADFEQLYANSEANLYEALRPAFEAIPKRLAAVECFEVPGREGLYLLPGHVNVSEYDVPLGVAHELSGSLGVMKNLPGAINALISATATEHAVDYVLIDMSPSISSLNQNLFMTSTHFVVPCSPDYFCALAIDSLTKVLPKWAQWPKRAVESDLFSGAAYPIPVHTPVFLGTINQRYRPRYGTPAQAFQRWIDRINERVSDGLVPVLKKNGMLLPEAAYRNASVNAEPYSLANIADFNTLIAKSQENGVPIYELTDRQLALSGPLLENTKRSREAFRQLFEELADTLIRMTTPPSGATTPKKVNKAGKKSR